MNAEAFRYFYNYHFAQNRRLWDRYIAALLTYAQFVQAAAYSHGSVREPDCAPAGCRRRLVQRTAKHGTV
jgi:hypothetical protein